MTQRKAHRGLDFEALRHAIERCDPDLILGFYAEEANLSIVNAQAQRSFPFELCGKGGDSQAPAGGLRAAGVSPRRGGGCWRGSGHVPGGMRVPGRRPCADRDDAGGARRQDHPAGRCGD